MIPTPSIANAAAIPASHYSRAYLRHLIIAKEMLAATLLSIHNLQTLIALTGEIRQAILAGQFDEFAREFLAQLEPEELSDASRCSPARLDANPIQNPYDYSTIHPARPRPRSYRILTHLQLGASRHCSVSTGLGYPP